MGDIIQPTAQNGEKSKKIVKNNGDTKVEAEGKNTNTYGRYSVLEGSDNSDNDGEVNKGASNTDNSEARPPPLIDHRPLNAKIKRIAQNSFKVTT